MPNATYKATYEELLAFREGTAPIVVPFDDGFEMDITPYPSGWIEAILYYRGQALNPNDVLIHRDANPFRRWTIWIGDAKFEATITC